MAVLRILSLLSAFLPMISLAAGDSLFPDASSFSTHDDQAQFQQAVSALVNQNTAKARVLLSPLADKGHAEAQSALGMLLLQTREPGTAQKGLRWIYKAARQGVWRAQARLATAHMNGEYLMRDLVKARYWMVQALAGGGSRVLKDLAVLNKHTLAEASSAKAAGDMGTMQDLLMSAAESGLPEAQYQLAMAYGSNSVPEPESKGKLYWLEMAAEQNHRPAQLEMARALLAQPSMSEEHRARAVFMLEGAASPGNRDAQYRLGQLYSAKWLSEADTGKANYWYRLAGEQGHEGAQYQLGVNYTVGEDADKDAAESYRWFKMAAAQGNNRAKYNLGVLSLHGRGVPRDPQQAQKWLSEAAQSGVKKAETLLRDKDAFRVASLSQPRDVEKKPAKAPLPRVTPMSGLEWFASLPSNGYTIQLITAQHKRSINELVAALGLGQEQLFVYRLNRKKSLHVAQYGFYANKKLASQAAKRISSRMKSFEPVIRRIGGVQKNIVRKVKG